PRGEVEVGVAGPREAVHAAVLAAPVRIHRLAEAHVGRLVAADDAARALRGDHGGRAGLQGLAGGVAEVVPGPPAVVLAAGAALLEAAGHARAGPAPLQRAQGREPCFAVVAHPASLGQPCRSRCDGKGKRLDALREAWQGLLSIPHLGAWLVGAWVAYLLLLGGWIILQKREPVATLSWLFGLALLPYLGFVVYHVFGPQRIHRQRLRRAHNRDALQVAEALGATAHPDAAEPSRLAGATTGLPPTTAREVRLLVDGAAKYRSLLADIAGARHHVHLEYYIYEPDRTGTALRDALVERARAGVRVRLLLDAIGSARAKRFFRPLLE